MMAVGIESDECRMPIQAPQWTDYLNCPVCCREFGAPPRSPISLGCGHTLCNHCLKHLHGKQCPFDQTVIQLEPEELVVNTALLQLAGYAPPGQPYHPPCIQALPEHERQAYDIIVRCMENLATYIKCCGNMSNSNTSGRLSRPMQRKLVSLLQCAITDEEGRGRAARLVRSLGERTVTELILHHQSPVQLGMNLWAAVRSRGCQFLGPAMQEEVLKLVLLALEDGSALSRKVLVMFVVQRLEPQFPQASKTSIGHVVQLLYRASCFMVSKRECDSSLMQLKEEFRTYEALRREHDTQVVQIATESGLRIAPEQWSALLYGDVQHKSHMQSIIDKLQTPQSFAQSVQELMIILQRTGDPAKLILLNAHLEALASINSSPDADSPTWSQMAGIMESLKEVIAGMTLYLQQAGRDGNHNPKLPERPEPSTSQPSPQNPSSTPTHSKYKVLMCRDATTRSYCPRGATCTFAHSEEELDRYRSIPNSNQAAVNGNFTFNVPPPPLPPPPLPQTMPMPQAMALPQMPVFVRYPQPQAHQHLDNYNPTQMTSMRPPHSDMRSNMEYMDSQSMHVDAMPQNLIHNRAQMSFNQSGMVVPERQFYSRFGTMMTIPEEQAHSSTMPYPREFPGVMYQGSVQVQLSIYQNPEQISAPMPNMFVPAPHEPQRNMSPYPFDDLPSELLPDYRVHPHGFVPVPRDRRLDQPWLPVNEAYNFDGMRAALPGCSTSAEDIFNMNDRRAMGAERMAVSSSADIAIRADDEELEEELQALERRIDTEFESAD